MILRYTVLIFILAFQHLSFGQNIEEQKRLFIENIMMNSDYEREFIEQLLSEIEIQQSILDAISRPAERVLTWDDYRGIFITDQRINAGINFYNEHRSEITNAVNQHGVPAEIILAILGVETNFGTRMGSYRVIDALGTLAFAYPPRSAFFSSELERFIELIQTESDTFREARGSYAGAMGAGQFISSSYLSYAVDGDGDGVRDLWESWPDIFASISNYFRRNGWEPGALIATRLINENNIELAEHTNTVNLNNTVAGVKELGLSFSVSYPDDIPLTLLKLKGPSGTEYWAGFHNFRSITRYNISVLYGMAIYELSEIYKSKIYN